MRDIVKTVAAIKKVVPTNCLELHAELDRIVSKACYTAPECQKQDWASLSNALFVHLGEPDSEWKKTVAGLMDGSLPQNHGETVQQAAERGFKS